MSRPYQVSAWKTAPFLRLLLPFTAGILLQWYFQFSLGLIIYSLISFSFAWLLFTLLPLAVRFKWGTLQGCVINVLLVGFGSFITWHNDLRHDRAWYGNHYIKGDWLIVKLDEPLTDKSKSYKAEARLEYLVHNDTIIDCKGNILLYFSKDSLAGTLRYGDRILINSNLQPIRNSGNPGSFNYEQYASFQQLYHQIYLKDSDWVSLKSRQVNRFKQFIYSTRASILSAMRRNMPEGRDELGLAEALLIGYTNDLDRDLVQAYSNTGVVHIIAISGMHLALIYVMLVWLFARIPLINKSKLFQLVLSLICLWLFSLLTGAAASVLRAAVMFSFIAIGRYLLKQPFIYNSLASSAFVLLCYNPYYLWDAGFLLSYLAVVGIIVFQRPVYNLLNIKYKPVNEVWKLVSVSLAAQVLTFPICIYYFHQFPLLFLLANIIAVPLSSLILYAEIVLIALTPLPVVAIFIGKLTSLLVGLMNNIIVRISHFSFALWDMIPATVWSTIILYIVVIAFSAWLINKNKNELKLALTISLLLVFTHAFIKWKVEKQQKLIVYNVPKQQAIDFVNGHMYRFLGDSSLQKEGLLQHFHLYPSRVALGLTENRNSLKPLYEKNIFYRFNNINIVLISEPWVFKPPDKKIDVDVIIISNNTRLSIPQLASVFNCRQYVFDASNSLWKIERWKADCSVLHLPGYSVPEKGAFVIDL